MDYYHLYKFVGGDPSEASEELFFDERVVDIEEVYQLLRSYRVVGLKGNTLILQGGTSISFGSLDLELTQPLAVQESTEEEKSDIDYSLEPNLLKMKYAKARGENDRPTTEQLRESIFSAEDSEPEASQDDDRESGARQKQLTEIEIFGAQKGPGGPG